MYLKSDINKLNAQFADAMPEDILRHFLDIYGNRIALSSSLGLEDQVLTDIILKIDHNARIFTLDTGRLFPETYQLLDKTNLKYNIKIEVFFPDYKQVENMVNQEGVNLFYESIEKRKKCCYVRKIEPLNRAFQTLNAWICGLRKQQSVTRKDLQLVAWDEINNLLKINPLIHWTDEQLVQYIKTNRVPCNKLHDKGFPSIGCEPCTRALKQGEDIRAGRWWWEAPEHKECGLHKR
ncbi:MAG: phosphoadenylyl-sulfate reductase [Bacteroidales bacterium]|jgi:phosphoadenosine phosphosulfate reductase|nr:phosphoadenylyl-sulfate reductase [Bacteroidales bacterium]